MARCDASHFFYAGVGDLDISVHFLPGMHR